MATRVDIKTDCDWCNKRGYPRLACESRPVPPEYKGTCEGDSYDLCGFCAMFYDIVMPRLEEVQEMMDTLPDFLKSAEPVKTTAPQRIAQTVFAEPPKAQQTAAQLTIVPDEHTTRPADAKPSAKKTGGEQTTRRRGTQDDPIVCYDCNPKQELPYRMRSRHADRVHGCKGWEVRWRLPNGQPLPHVCDKHEQCSASGYGFLAISGLHRHETEGGEGLIAWQDADGPDAEASAEPPGEAEEATPIRRTAGGKRAPNKTGAWVDGVDQVGCPLAHDNPNAESPYFVEYAKRNDHARRVHQLRVEEIDWFTREGTPFRLDKVCGICGVGFPTDESLDRHMRSMKSTPNPPHQAAA